MVPENLHWAYPGNEPNPYQVEHHLLFDAIRNDKPYNEGHRACDPLDLRRRFQASDERK